MMTTNETHEEPEMTAGSPGATVFYDGACPLCAREIAHYRRLRGADRLNWVDISEDHSLLDRYGLNLETAMARLHVLDAAGNWQTGAWGFAEIWSQLPAYRWLAVILRRSRALPLLDRAYAAFARWRLRRSCEDGHCTTRHLARPAYPGGGVSPEKRSGATRHPQTRGERSCA
jgi:predicted DCC family thiol-disulfide oxidoreductase YuxK